MSILLRGALITASVLTTVIIMRKIRKEKMVIEDSLFWIGFLFMLTLFSIFPQIVFRMSELIGTQSPSNLIFLFIIFVLIVRMFQMSIKISQMEAKMKDLVARIAIDETMRNEKIKLKEETNSKEAIKSKEATKSKEAMKSKEEMKV